MKRKGLSHDDAVLGSAWLNDKLETSPEWRHGAIQVVSATQIGANHGMSGLVHRVVADTERGGRMTIVVKQESADAVDRELLFRRHCDAFVRGSVPRLYGSRRDEVAGSSVLALEDIAPAEQGDVLNGCTQQQGEAIVRVLARLHASTWSPHHDALPADLPRWSAKAMEPDPWVDRVSRASDRFPAILTEGLVAQLHDLPERVTLALAELRDGPVSWIQVDAHLDNVLWRSDGRAVLVDWCDAAIGPPVTDLTRLLSEGIEANSRPALVTAYTHELQSRGCSADPADISAGVERAVLFLLQSAVGWAGREDFVWHPRPALVCEAWLWSVCDWALGSDTGSYPNPEN